VKQRKEEEDEEEEKEEKEEKILKTPKSKVTVRDVLQENSTAINKVNCLLCIRSIV